VGGGGGGGLSLGLDRPGCEVDQSSKFSAKSKNELSYGFSSDICLRDMVLNQGEESVTFICTSEHFLYLTQSRYRNLTFVGPCIIMYLYSKTNKMHQCIKFILFCNNILHVSDGLSVHHQQFKTVHTATNQIVLSAC